VLKIAKLSSHDADLAKEIEAFSKYVQDLGAIAGVQRLELICQNFDNLAPDVAYHWLDPAGLQRDVEGIQLRRSQFWHNLRSILSILPLILTWLALFYAANEYTQDLAKYHSDISLPFLKLWQDGFHGVTFFTFSVAAFTDFILLTLYLLCSIYAQRLEHKAEIITAQFSQRLHEITERLMVVVASEGISHIRSASDVDTVANAVKRVVDRSLDANQQMSQANQQVLTELQASFQAVIKELSDQTADFYTKQLLPALTSFHDMNAQLARIYETSMKELGVEVKKSFEDLNSQTTHIYTQQIAPMMTTFRQDIATLSAAISTNQKQFTDLTGSIASLGVATEQLTVNADKYVNIGVDINKQITQLNDTQQKVIQKIDDIAKDITLSSRSIEAVARELTLGTKQDIAIMVNQITRGADAMRQVEIQLSATTQHLERAAESLSEVEIGNGNSSGLVPIVPWIIGRTTKRFMP